MASQNRVTHLLEKLRALNEESKTREPQVLELPESGNETIQTLHSTFERCLSPMLEARFKFCGNWKNAHLSQDWLSLSEIKDWRQNKKLVEWINLSIENSYDSEPPGGV